MTNWLDFSALSARKCLTMSHNAAPLKDDASKYATCYPLLSPSACNTLQLTSHKAVKRFLFQKQTKQNIIADGVGEGITHAAYN